MIASVRSIQAASAGCGAALASARRLHSLALRKFIRCDGTTRPRSLSARYRRRGDCGNLLNMVTRRELLLGTAGGWLGGQGWGGGGARRGPADTPPPLPRPKTPLPPALPPPHLPTPPPGPAPPLPPHPPLL